MKIIGCVSGYNDDDKRCNECVDFSLIGRTIYEGEDFSCTYCGDRYKDGLTSQQRYERKHNVKHCDNCLSYAAPFDGDKCADCVAEETTTETTTEVVEVPLIVCFDCDQACCVCDQTRCPECFEMYRSCICVTYNEGCNSDDPFCECLFCIPGV